MKCNMDVLEDKEKLTYSFFSQVIKLLYYKIYELLLQNQQQTQIVVLNVITLSSLFTNL